MSLFGSIPFAKYVTIFLFRYLILQTSSAPIPVRKIAVEQTTARINLNETIYQIRAPPLPPRPLASLLLQRPYPSINDSRNNGAKKVLLKERPRQVNYAHKITLQPDTRKNVQLPSRRNATKYIHLQRLETNEKIFDIGLKHETAKITTENVTPATTMSTVESTLPPIIVSTTVHGTIAPPPPNPINKLPYDLAHFNGSFTTNAVTSRQKLWPNGIVYFEMNNVFSSDEKVHIFKAIRQFHEKTCVRFILRHHQRDYVYFDKVIGCKSDVGRKKGKQTISLADETCFIEGTIMHELMHALGFYHEHERNDRDKFISIQWENIIEDQKLEFFIIQPNVSLTVKYDYNSLMHYNKFAFTKNSLPTILPKISNVNIGQRIGFSQIDLFEINVLYKCLEKH